MKNKMYANKELLKTLLCECNLMNQCIIEFIRYFFKNELIETQMKEVMEKSDVTIILNREELNRELITIWEKIDTIYQDARDIVLSLILIFRINPNTKIVTADNKIYRAIGLCFIRYKDHLIDKYGYEKPTGEIDSYEVLLLTCIKLMYHGMICNIISFGEI